MGSDSEEPILPTAWNKEMRHQRLTVDRFLKDNVQSRYRQSHKGLVLHVVVNVHASPVRGGRRRTTSLREFAAVGRRLGRGAKAL
jgi:hypothetical protein